MAIRKAGETTHFIVQYDDTSGLPALTVANAVLAICEVDLLKLTVYMPSHRGGGGDPFLGPDHRIDINIVNDPTNGPGPGGADNNGYFPGRKSLIRINPFVNAGTPSLNPATPDGAGFLFVAEMSEILMGFYGWDGGSSQGEALSRVMAEELHPASSFNFVNTWLSWPRPRPDWISKNEPAGGPLARGDLDPIAYGCGIVFIYFLRYQLGFSYDRICQAGGTLLSDRYRKLTGAADDPATRLGTLLDEHFGTGQINLVGNNPFPLYEGAERKVMLAFSKSTQALVSLPDSGWATIRPFFNCRAKKYPFTAIGANVTQTITATTLGIGFPAFKWKINGKALPARSKLGENVRSDVNVPDPQNPDHPTPGTENLTFDYRISNAFNTSGGSSALTLTTRSFGGDYNVMVHVDADELAAPQGPVAAQQALRLHTRTIVYGGTYAADRRQCADAFRRGVSGKVRVIQGAVNRIRNLPDPPPPDYLPSIIEAIDRIIDEIARISVTDIDAAERIARYAAMELGVPAHTFMKRVLGGAPAKSA